MSKAVEIQEYKTKRGLHYYEQYYQMKHHVLTAVIEGTDEPAYYNKNVGGVRFYVPLEVYEDPERGRKISVSNSKGPYRITFDTGKEIIVDNLTGWAGENNYNDPMLFGMLHNRKKRRKKGSTKVYPRKRYKDIVKVERLSDEEKE